VVLDLVLIGLAITLDPLPLTAFLIALPSKGGARKGAAYVFGWLVSLAIVVTATVLATGNNPPKPNTAPSLAALAVKIAIGAVLVVIAVRHIRTRGRPKPPKKPPKWQQHVDNMSPWFAMGLAPTLQPWVMIGAGAATVVQAKLSSWESYLALAGFCVLASASYLALEIYAVARPGPSRALLGRFRTWLDTRTDQVIIVGSLLLGLWLIASPSWASSPICDELTTRIPHHRKTAQAGPEALSPSSLPTLAQSWLGLGSGRWRSDRPFWIAGSG
jgi:threonine/homoserine/homoserine lactone efflux protein